MMLIFYWISGVLLGVLWLWKALDVFLGMPKVDDISQPQWEATGATLPQTTIVVPARNEAESIRQCLSSLLALDYPEFEIIAVNDRSTDSTGAIMDELAASAVGQRRLRVIHVTELPPRWLGKTHAMWRAASLATGEWILFTDGDINFRRDALRRAIAYAEAKRADHLVLLPSMIMDTPGERMMIGFFINNLAFIHRLWKVSDPKARDFVGAGAFNMVRKGAYERIGTYEAMRLEIVDDLALGKTIKAHGFSQRAIIGHGLIRLRWAKGAIGVVHNLTKNTFAIMRFNWAISLGSALGLLLIGWGPLLGVIFAPGLAKTGFATALASNAMIYSVMARITRVSPIYFLTYPVGCLLAMYTLTRSTFVTLWQGGVTWRGTKYSLSELRGK